MRLSVISGALFLSSLLYLSSTCMAQADLLVSTVDGSALVFDAQALTVSGMVSTTIRNDGDVAAGAFDLTFFEDLNHNGQFDALGDRVLGGSSVASLAAGATVQSNAVLGGEVEFRQSLIFAFVDSGAVVVESDETNNYGNSGADCIFNPGAALITPQIEWSWTSSSVESDALNVMMTPSIMDLDGDQIPEVIFGSTSSTGGGLVEIGVLRALRGSDGLELFTVNNPLHLISTTASIAVGDIDQDGLPEIIACAASNNRLIAFENDGTFKWFSDLIQNVNWGAPSIADLDGDGSPEIVIGRQALDANGLLLWTGTGGIGGATGFPLSIVADIDLDGEPNVIAGNTVYNADGSILWQIAIPDGHGAVGNFDLDPFPEIVHVAGGQVRLIDHLGNIVWGPVPIPGGGTGGPPTVADYDGDGMPEIGVAGAARYAVFETDGTLKWQSVTQDGSSNRTGSSVFDFNGDGAAEVVYRDELFLRLYNGLDGTVLFQTPLSSCTWHEYVLVADVDADGNAEIIAVANNNCGFGPQRGIFVFGDPTDNWVATRQIWNQHSYHITNVNDDGTIPLIEDNNWLTPAGMPFNNYRQNVLTTASSALAASDLTASFLRFGCAAQPSVTARMGNGGAVVAGAGLPMSFYDGDPNAGGVLLGTVPTTAPLQPGTFQDLTLNLPMGFGSSNAIFARVDDDGTGVSSENECDETNNTHSRLFLTCTTPAAFSNYGAGWPGNLGVPSLSVSALPILGTGIDILIENSRPEATTVCILVGLSPLSLLTSIGGTVLVDPVTEPLLYIPVGISPYAAMVPCSVDLCGVSIYIQVIEWDPAASQNYSFTPGLELILGE
ncbi:MAG: FG-GAP-like repeat-containing protein [Planctomycetota bacterium]